LGREFQCLLSGNSQEVLRLLSKDNSNVNVLAGSLFDMNFVFSFVAVGRWTPCHDCCFQDFPGKNESLNMLRMLLLKGADINFRDLANNDSPLSLAAAYSLERVVRDLFVCMPKPVTVR